jgi:DNA-binding response OmpR family regulator
MEKMNSDLLQVLIVESDPATAELYSQTISQEFRVLTCGNEAEVIEMVKNLPLSAIVLEPALLGGRGWTILSAISKELAGNPVPIILCTILDDRKRGLSMGAVAYLTKPVLPVTLLEVLRQVTQSAK